MLIDGKLVESESGRQFDNVNPATEEVMGGAADGTRADMERAVAAARHAFDHTDWSRDGEARAAGLRQLQAALEAEREELRSELVAEVGCPVLSTYGPQLDVPLNEALTWPADMISQFPWKRSLPDKDAFGMGTPAAREVWKEPIGVVGVIAPWNFPFEIILNKIGPILAMGNTCVLKPAPDTPWNATRIGRIIAENTDIPPGVINIVTSSDHLAGEVLSTSPLVDMVAFTGSTATGRRVMQAAAQTIKPTFLELGGKSVYLVLEDDGDLKASIAGSAFISMHAGQGCAMPTRLLVPNSRYEEAVEIVKVAMERNKYGDPTDPSVLQGPQVSKRQQERVLGYIEKGKQEGARLVTGGSVPKHLPKGYYVEPTVFADVDNRMTIAQEEIFGPVLSVIGFDDDDDAVRIANDSIYGLSGVLFASDLDRAKAVAGRIRTGTLGINGGLWYGADAPFGGYKQSGIGRQCGIEGLEIFTETKTVGWPAS
ncbi:aldehyde dehydrogenase family protein [Mycolicibacterium vanbaalenii]|nr:aldehyde dehydrogenase family protein [Mycolicibacterium vanbaalenii]